jgi:hypothetical protein
MTVPDDVSVILVSMVVKFAQLEEDVHDEATDVEMADAIDITAVVVILPLEKEVLGRELRESEAADVMMVLLTATTTELGVDEAATGVVPEGVDEGVTVDVADAATSKLVVTLLPKAFWISVERAAEKAVVGAVVAATTTVAGPLTE